MTTDANCPLCTTPLPGALLSTDDWTVIDACDADYPAFTRVVWHSHVKEMTDLSPDARTQLMAVVFTVESVMREILQPDKMNLACLGNQVPHIHWHVIGRWQDDQAFPASVWTASADTGAAKARRQAIQSRLNDYHQTLIQRLTETFA